MEKSMLRAFLLSLVIFLALNFLIYIIAYAMADLLDVVFNTIADHPSQSIFLTTYPNRYFPWELFSRSAETSSFEFKLFYIGGFISFVVAAIIAGFMGGDIIKSLEGWFLTVFVSTGLLIIMILIDDFNLGYIKYGISLTEGIVIVVIAGLVNALIYGVIVFLIALLLGRSS